MTSPPKNQLWTPSHGIRFSPTRAKANNTSQPLYPSLDQSRFFNAAPLALSSNLPISTEEYEFSDDEQFERDASEWFDQQDELAKAKAAQESPEKTATPPGQETDVSQTKPKEAPPKPTLPPKTNLDYQISNELFKTALESKPESPESYWSYLMYQHVQPGGITQKVKVHYCRTKHTMEWVCKRYFLGEPVLGFDLEWVAGTSRDSGPRKNVSLIQIASPSRIALFHVALFTKDDFVAPTFRTMMEDEGVSKVGVNIRGDFTRLKKFLDIEAKGIFELSHLYKLVKYSKEKQLNLINRNTVAMAIQVQDFLRLPLCKDQSVRSSNWMRPLSPRQVSYSASDAYAGIQLYHVLEAEREKLDPCPPRPHFAEKGLAIRVATVPDKAEEAKPSPDLVVELKPDDTREAGTSQREPPQEGASSPEESSATVSKRTDKPSKPTSTRSSKPPQDPRIAAAELRLQTYRSTKKTLTTTPACLRAYFIWHDNKGLTPESVATVLRNPPLQTGTVVSYILRAVCDEGLPHERQRLKTEVLSFLAPTVIFTGKMKAFLDDLKKADETEEKSERIGQELA